MVIDIMADREGKSRDFEMITCICNLKEKGSHYKTFRFLATIKNT